MRLKFRYFLKHPERIKIMNKLFKIRLLALLFATAMVASPLFGVKVRINLDTSDLCILNDVQCKTQSGELIDWAQADQGQRRGALDGALVSQNITGIDSGLLDHIALQNELVYDSYGNMLFLVTTNCQQPSSLLYPRLRSVTPSRVDQQVGPSSSNLLEDFDDDDGLPLFNVSQQLNPHASDRQSMEVPSFVLFTLKDKNGGIVDVPVLESSFSEGMLFDAIKSQLTEKNSLGYENEFDLNRAISAAIFNFHQKTEAAPSLQSFFPTISQLDRQAQALSSTEPLPKDSGSEGESFGSDSESVSVNSSGISVIDSLSRKTGGKPSLSPNTSKKIREKRERERSSSVTDDSSSEAISVSSLHHKKSRKSTGSSLKRSLRTRSASRPKALAKGSAQVGEGSSEPEFIEKLVEVDVPFVNPGRPWLRKTSLFAGILSLGALAALTGKELYKFAKEMLPGADDLEKEAKASDLGVDPNASPEQDEKLVSPRLVGVVAATVCAIASWRLYKKFGPKPETVKQMVTKRIENPKYKKPKPKSDWVNPGKSSVWLTKPRPKASASASASSFVSSSSSSSSRPSGAKTRTSVGSTTGSKGNHSLFSRFTSSKRTPRDHQKIREEFFDDQSSVSEVETPIDLRSLGVSEVETPRDRRSIAPLFGDGSENDNETFQSYANIVPNPSTVSSGSRFPVRDKKTLGDRLFEEDARANFASLEKEKFRFLAGEHDQESVPAVGDNLSTLRFVANAQPKLSFLNQLVSAAKAKKGEEAVETPLVEADSHMAEKHKKLARIFPSNNFSSPIPISLKEVESDDDERGQLPEATATESMDPVSLIAPTAETTAADAHTPQKALLLLSEIDTANNSGNEATKMSKYQELRTLFGGYQGQPSSSTALTTSGGQNISFVVDPELLKQFASRTAIHLSPGNLQAIAYPTFPRKPFGPNPRVEDVTDKVESDSSADNKSGGSLDID